MFASVWLLPLSIGLVAAVIFFLQPRLLLAAATALVPGVAYFATTEDPIIALTIDDGPDAIATAKILEVLKEYGARATFFVISGRIEGNEPLLRKMLEDGHELGNHLTEDRPSIQLSPREFERDVLEAHAALSQFARPRWLRPGGGWHDRKMVEVARKYGYRVALGSIFPYDTHIPSSWFAARHILFNARPGAVIVLHDSGSRGKRTAITLERILPELYCRGYRVVALSELFA
jgi:peptidoglycan/xylan/chitin deacetylase (PgdA/CDA1 family)